MKPPRFDYLAAESVEEALEALAAEGGEASVLAGGQSLLPMLNMRLARPRLLVDIMGIAAWRGIALERGWIRISAAVRQAELEAFPELSRLQPLLATTLSFVGHPQIRSRGTVCGSLAHADPSAELPLALVALEGIVHLRSRRGAREVAATDFFIGTMTTARGERFRGCCLRRGR
jgi:2-furoyl-CoA dehydrogenase FAD binding subunit